MAGDTAPRLPRTSPPSPRQARNAAHDQVVLSLQLPFAVVPLVRFTTDRKQMGELVAPRWVAVLAWLVAAVIIGLNMKLLFDVATGA
jgi:manganese transport protein